MNEKIDKSSFYRKKERTIVPTRSFFLNPFTQKYDDWSLRHIHPPLGEKDPSSLWGNVIQDMGIRDMTMHSSKGSDPIVYEKSAF